MHVQETSLSNISKQIEEEITKKMDHSKCSSGAPVPAAISVNNSSHDPKKM